jgi:hypothetical protein
MRRRPANGFSIVACAVLMVLTLASPAGASETELQRRIDGYLARFTNATQVSDNSIAWPDGSFLTLVDTGERFAPPGLGRNVMPDRARAVGLGKLADGDVTILDVQGCPSGYFTFDAHCFYRYRDFGGDRWTINTPLCRANAADYGFNNITSSWVNTDTDKTILASDTTDYQGGLWSEPENTQDAYVGSWADNRMSSWNANNC